MSLVFPKHVLSLDIETFLTKKGTLPRCFLVGWSIYEYTQRLGYIKRGYVPNDESQINSQMADFLNNWHGLIIGHNLFGFDYKVLSQYIDVSGAKNKSCDTLQVLRKLGHKGLSLDNLAQLNWGEHKQLSGKDVGRLWSLGKRDQVIQYNAKDCEMNMRLWTLLLREQEFKVSPNEVVRLNKFVIADLLNQAKENPISAVTI